MKARPKNLPDFGRPPLHEVVLGAQFSPARGYQQIRAGEVWSLFKHEFPRVQEQPPLDPAFETFGLSQPGLIGGRLSFVTGAMHDRFWFLNKDGDELIQFQNDRLLHNWRKVGDHSNEYPRFEHMIMRFGEELRKLENYFSTLVPQLLAVNQCEVSYINHIDVGPGELNPNAWLRGLAFEGVAVDDMNVGFREVVRGENNQPVGRVTYEATNGIKPDGQRMIVLNITVRGSPISPDIDSALRFLATGREIIVRRFAEITTDSAHKIWERRQ